MIDLGESVAQAAVGETLEESRIECAITGIVGIYSNPRHVLLYTSSADAEATAGILHPPQRPATEARYVGSVTAG